MQLGFVNGVTSVVLRLKLRKLSDGTPYTTLDHTSSGLIIAAIADSEATTTAYTSAGSTVETIATLGTFAAPTATKCRFKEVDATNHAGLYEIQIADARWAVSGARSINVTVSGVSDLEQVDTVIQLAGYSSGIRKNVALSAFPFFMADSSDHISAKTGLTITAQRSIDGAAFAACANSATEVANGMYKIDLAAADLNGDTITLRFTATGADARLITIKTTP